MKRSAFTLVELLVVIAIIAMLVSILLPVLSSARRTVMTTQCLANQRQLGLLLTQYMDDWKDWVPPQTYNWAGSPPATPSSDPANPDNTHVGWAWRLTYNNRYMRMMTTTDTSVKGLKDIRLCPETMALDTTNPRNSTGHAHYTAIMQIGGYSSTHGVWIYRPTLRREVHIPAMTTLLSEVKKTNHTSNPNHIQGPGSSLEVTNNGRWRLGNTGLSLESSLSTRPAVSRFRHQGDVVNFLFLDGHAEARKFRQPDAEAGSMAASPNAAQYLEARTAGGFGKIIGPIRNVKYDGF